MPIARPDILSVVFTLFLAKVTPGDFERIFKHDYNFILVLKLFTGLAIAASIVLETDGCQCNHNRKKSCNSEHPPFYIYAVCKIQKPFIYYPPCNRRSNNDGN